ncbi:MULTISPECIES: o-succinylbenzoate synthase [unclassified Halorhodospira]|uniref:o-succinylbenzoate synthase n=1 Tax=unclassified Halorhodospira TaxID=2626748 RepID=UPI001EE875BB|nr:o-succinylbenzoate synthase [Halorhodospira sp. M39old]MCG5546369.1 o-succinylbenzoate synthase [Halorhodospira sp. M38]
MTVRLRSVELCRYRVALLPGTALVAERHGALLFWTAEGGRRAVSEIAPLPGFSTEGLDECIDACRRFFGAGAGRVGADLQQAHSGAGESGALQALPPAARFGLEAGWLQLLHPPGATPRVSSCRLLGHEDEAIEGPAPSCVKVKVGRASVAEDAERLARILDRLPATTRLRLDANRSWTPEEAARLCAGLPAERVAFIEEPLRPGASYAGWSSRTAIPFAWDETLREHPDADLTTAGLGAVVLKPMLTGLTRTRAWIDAATSAGVQVVLSAAFESNITLDLYARLAARWGLQATPGLDTFGAWPEALLEPLRSQPGHTTKPVRRREQLTAEAPLL